jgi:signal transduction histidine kinase
MRWLRGKRGGLIAFLAIAALVAGGLGWVTVAALDLEREQLEARAETELHAKLRLALWRLDSYMIPELSREASRPFAHYSAIYVPMPAFSRQGKPLSPGSCLELSPLLTADLPEWTLLHFSAAENSWWSPQVLSDTLRKRLSRVMVVPQSDDAGRAYLLEELFRNVSLQALFEQVRQQEQNQLAFLPVPPVDDTVAQNQKNPPWTQQQPAQQSVQEFQNRNLRLSQADFLTKQKKGGGNFARVGNYEANSMYYGALSPNNESLLSEALGKKLKEKHGKPPAPVENDKSDKSARDKTGEKTKESLLSPDMVDKNKVENVAPGPMTAFWVCTGASREHLLVARRVRVGEKQVCQGMVLNWEALRSVLAAEIDELFPEAELRPMRALTPPHPERTMTALPVELVPGALVLADAGWTPLRIGLALAWAAALVALLAVGLGGWSLLNLSERRFRFVSTVTHELRTPLTTLRLYLDMLTGGFVQDERQKEEYLNTLHGETDRLHRLVGNVLDFSRLENQHPRLEKSSVLVADVLEQARSTWQTRARDAGKDLVIENSLPADARLNTDVNLVQQVLGNLIDNACKYSRAAEDRRLWLRAAAHGRSVAFEVEDRGPGVATRERRAIFRPFRRGRDAENTPGGVGLGLALARRWTTLLGGKLSVVPGRDNVGACFRVELPR